MNIELTLNKMGKKHNFTYAMQPMAYDTRRAVIPVGSWHQLEYIQNIFRHMKVVKIETWYRFEGCFEGYVYVWEIEEYNHHEAEWKAEMARSWNWWERYNRADAETKRLMACGAIA